MPITLDFYGTSGFLNKPKHGYGQGFSLVHAAEAWVLAAGMGIAGNISSVDAGITIRLHGFLFHRLILRYFKPGCAALDALEFLGLLLVGSWVYLANWQGAGITEH
jgi:hypothetical protein